MYLKIINLSEKILKLISIFQSIFIQFTRQRAHLVITFNNYFKIFINYINSIKCKSQILFYMEESSEFFLVSLLIIWPFSYGVGNFGHLCFSQDSSVNLDNVCCHSPGELTLKIEKIWNNFHQRFYCWNIFRMLYWMRAKKPPSPGGSLQKGEAKMCFFHRFYRRFMPFFAFYLKTTSFT